MNTALIIKVILVVLFVGLGYISIYLKTNKKLLKKVSTLIAESEILYKDYTKAGNKKFEWVVDKLYSYVPKALRIVITRKMLSDIVQSTFDALEKYATKQMDNATDTLTNNKVQE